MPVQALKDAWGAELERPSSLVGKNPSAIRRVEPRDGPGSNGRPTGGQLAAALRGLVGSTGCRKERWRDGSTGAGSHRPSISTVLEQMNAWVDNVELAFGDEALPLGGLAAGSPKPGWRASAWASFRPPLDQVLIGAIDRSRNPELKAHAAARLERSRFFPPCLNRARC